MSSTITLGSNSYTLIPLPTAPGIRDITLGMSDSVAVNQSPFVPSQVQTQQWPGADMWDVQVALPPLTDAQAADWEGFLAELRGMLNVFQIGDPRRVHPLGNMQGSAPLCAAGNTQNSTSLLTTQWKANASRLLLRGDMLQIVYRLYRVCETVNSDSSGNATIVVWPSLREAPADNTPLVMNAPQAVFRLAQNRRQSQFSKQQHTSISFKAIEVR
jgi:hypothetical protein